MIPWLPPAPIFPSVTSALDRPNGLLAAGGDLSPERLIAAYRHGIFPWFSEGDPILWWSPDPRMVLYPAELKISRSLARTLRKGGYDVRFDTAFEQVIQACAERDRPGQPGTWITGPMQRAYLHLHRIGFAHSIETWCDDQLVGGLYGVAIGKVFYGESMFALARDASKIALAHLCHYLKQQDFGIIDCQMETPHLASLGARPIARSDFVRLLAGLVGPEDALPEPWPREGVNGVFQRSDET
ncbi:MAG: leucyl/phenylalanyl-tRNA--protein transferase [Proteobacteria bacterium]|nr:leucyl/phenylalanyl-tRNA--protein transferase [Pseudomonadota bacterium]